MHNQSPLPRAEDGHGQPARILHSIVDITGERNFDDIRLSLVRTIFEMLPARSLLFYNLSRGGAQVHLNELLRVSRGADGLPCVQGLGRRGLLPDPLQRQALDSAAPYGHVRDDRCIEYTPILFRGQVIELIATELDGPEGGDGVLRAMLRLYANIVDLIHDKEMDTLTGVLNRRAFDSQLEGLVRQPQQCGTGPDGERQCWWLVMLDADHFKSINDTYGHLIGDEVLILLARLMREHFRAIDGVYRYGGEEFAVILAPSSAAEAQLAVERLRELIAEHRFPQVGQVTISAGMVALDHFDHISTVIGQADRALYFAKQNGRNQVCEYHALVEAGLVRAESGHEVELF